MALTSKLVELTSNMTTNKVVYKDQSGATPTDGNLDDLLIDGWEIKGMSRSFRESYIALLVKP